MKRRLFIQNGILAASGLFLPSYRDTKPQRYNLVMIRGGSPAAMLDVGLEVFGNSSYFVQKGQTVLIKPTMQWPRKAEPGANTNPDLLAALVRRCYDAGSKEVLLLGQTKNSWAKCFKNSGIERAVKDAGAKILSADKASLFEEIEIPNAKELKKVKIHRAVLESDLVINVPAVRPDPGFVMFGAFRNLIGLVWDGENQVKTEQCMIDLLYFRKPALNVMDLYRVPLDGELSEAKEYRTLILSTDLVPAEVFAAKRLGIKTSSLRYIELAAQAGFGKIDPPRESLRSIVLKNSQTGK
jgi:uncharacterized protein (DUF362 family)